MFQRLQQAGETPRGAGQELFSSKFHIGIGNLLGCCDLDQYEGEFVGIADPFEGLLPHESALL